MLDNSFFFMLRCSSFWSFPISAGIDLSFVLVSFSHRRLVMSSTASGKRSPSRLFKVRSMPRMNGRTPVPAIFTKQFYTRKLFYTCKNESTLLTSSLHLTLIRSFWQFTQSLLLEHWLIHLRLQQGSLRRGDVGGGGGAHLQDVVNCCFLLLPALLACHNNNSQPSRQHLAL